MASMIMTERVRHTFGSIKAFAEFACLSRPTVYKLLDDTRERSLIERATLDFCVAARRAGWHSVTQIDMTRWREMLRGAPKAKLARRFGVTRQGLHAWLNAGGPRAPVAAGMLYIAFGDAAVAFRKAERVSESAGIGGAIGATPLTVEHRAHAVVDACEAMLEENGGLTVTWIGRLNLEQIEHSLRLRNRDLTDAGVQQLAKRMSVEFRLMELASVFSEVRLVDAAAEDVHEGLRAVKRGDLVVFDERQGCYATKQNLQTVIGVGAQVLVVAG